MASRIRSKPSLPKKVHNKIVIGKFAQGDDVNKTITAGIEAPFLYNCMLIARTPCEHVDKSVPRRAAVRRVRLLDFESIFSIYRLGTNVSMMPEAIRPSKIATHIIENNVLAYKSN
tara:strand:+ start:160 stop:507 length:348 start_codon:yes stop_codon:yes gene_type:complete